MPPRPDRITVYRRALRAHSRAARLSQAIIDGLALGLFDRQTLSELDRQFYDDARELVAGKQRPFRDELSIRQGLHDWEQQVIEEVFPPEGRIVVTAAGAGREVLALCEMGYDAWGFEPHAALVAAGDAVLSRLGYPGRLEVCARDAWPTQAGSASAVVIGWTSYTHIPDRWRRQNLLDGARRALPAGGPLVASFGVRSGWHRDLQVVALVAGALRRARHDDPVEYGDWLAGDARAPMFVHLFSEPEMRAELSASGFATERFREAPCGHVVGRAR